MKTVIYFIRNTKSGYIKIGLATNAEARLRALQTGAEYRLELLATEAGGYAREQALHQQFDDLRVRADGEWFRPGPELTRYVDWLAAKTEARCEAIETGRDVIVRPASSPPVNNETPPAPKSPASVKDTIFGEETTPRPDLPRSWLLMLKKGRQ